MSKIERNILSLFVAVLAGCLGALPGYGVAFWLAWEYLVDHSYRGDMAYDKGLAFIMYGPAGGVVTGTIAAILTWRWIRAVLKK